MKKLLLQLYSLVFSLIIIIANAQDGVKPTYDKVHAVARQTEEIIQLDGKLEERSWTMTKSIGAFTQVEPLQGKPSESRTDVKILFDGKNLYVGVYCDEPKGRKGLRVPDLKRDFNWRAHDTFAICFDGFNDRRNSISIVTNPYGAQKDYLSFDDTYFDSDWNGLWRVRTTRTDSSWTAEFEIPWKTLRYPPQSDSLRSWGVNFLRLRRNSNEISVWSPYPRSFGFSRMEYAGRLDSLIAPPPSANIQINPYFLITSRRTKGNEIGNTETSDIKFGGELKYAINANTVLDLTANTDFAQADADVRVNNISRFSVLFPERRQFFLENASLFGTGLMGDNGQGGKMVILPFFSRQIGLNNGVPIPIDGGARLVHRSLKSNYGGIFMRQGESPTTPRADFFTARYACNVGKQNRIGTLITTKSVSETDSTNSFTNITGAIDGFFRLNKASSVNAMLITSRNTTDNGYAGYVQYFYTTNFVRAWWSESVLTKTFNPEVGFISRRNVIATTPGFVMNLRGGWVPLKKYIRAFKPGAALELYHESSSRIMIEKEINVTPFSVELQSGGYLSYSIASVYQHLLSEFKPLDVVMQKGTYHFMRNILASGSDASQKISYAAQYEWGDYFGGMLRTMDFNLNIAPIPNIALRAGVNYNKFSGFEELSTEVTLYSVESRFALNPRLQLTGLYQYNTQNKLTVYNIRLAWEYKPLSYIYVVLNNRNFSTTEQQLEQSGILKLTYLKQF